MSLRISLLDQTAKRRIKKHSYSDKLAQFLQEQRAKVPNLIMLTENLQREGTPITITLARLLSDQQLQSIEDFSITAIQITGKPLEDCTENDISIIQQQLTDYIQRFWQSAVDPRQELSSDLRTLVSRHKAQMTLADLLEVLKAIQADIESGVL